MNEDNEKRNERHKEREKDAKWYVVHTYSGHENKVKDNIEKMVENRGYIDDIFEVAVPTEEYVETKNGVKKIKERKMFPSYVLIKMIITDVSWFLVRNTRGVTGFVGPGSKPVPLTEKEVKAFGVQTVSIPEMDIEIGDSIKVISGPFEGFVGKVESVSPEKLKLKAAVSIFGRETLVELDFDNIERV
ncbi:MAG: transcription termination/antitermination protein NusG [Tissierellia bacterium]|nr:transcription termination/antitermination protein NusG [Tissierellia bacterium]